MPLPMRRLGQGLEVSCIGYGCMGNTAFYGAAPEGKEGLIRTMVEAINQGCTFFDTAELYNVGLTADNNEQLLGEAVRASGVPRERLVLATKWGIYMAGEGQFVTDGSRAHCREAVEASLRNLGVEYIDLYYLHRKDPKVPIEESMQAMKVLRELVDEGKIRHIGLSEVSAADVRKAHAIHPVAAYQLEWSLWTRDAEAEVVPLCRELGIGLVAYSPLGRGFLTGSIKSPADLGEGDFRRVGQPRFAEEAFAKNMELVDRVRAIAERKGCTVAQLALAWVLSRGPDVVPIPGTRRVERLHENLGAAGVRLSGAELAELEAAFPADQVVGDRYPESQMAMTFHYGNQQQQQA